MIADCHGDAMIIESNNYQNDFTTVETANGKLVKQIVGRMPVGV